MRPMRAPIAARPGVRLHPAGGDRGPHGAPRREPGSSRSGPPRGGHPADGADVGRIRGGREPGRSRAPRGDRRRGPPEIDRVVIMGLDGVVIYDSSGESVGANFANGRRPEVDEALRERPTPRCVYSETEGRNILVAAAPVIDETQVGAIRLTRDFTEVDESRRPQRDRLEARSGRAMAAGVLIAFGLAGRSRTRSSAWSGPPAGWGEATSRLRRQGRGERRGPRARRVGGRHGRPPRAVGAGTARVRRERLASAPDAADRHEAAPRGGPGRCAPRRPPAPARGCRQEVDRLSEIVDRLLVMSREIEQGVPTTVDLADAVRRAFDRWHERAERRDSTLVASGEDITAQANPTDVDQILDNLLDNALAYAPGTIEVRTAEDDGVASIEVRDHGPGIPPGEQDRVVERFYRGQGSPPGARGSASRSPGNSRTKWEAPSTSRARPTEAPGSRSGSAEPPPSHPWSHDECDRGPGLARPILSLGVADTRLAPSLQDQGEVRLEHRLFSLEVNATSTLRRSRRPPSVRPRDRGARPGPTGGRPGGVRGPLPGDRPATPRAAPPGRRRASSARRPRRRASSASTDEPRRVISVTSSWRSTGRPAPRTSSGSDAAGRRWEAHLRTDPRGRPHGRGRTRSVARGPGAAPPEHVLRAEALAARPAAGGAPTGPSA